MSSNDVGEGLLPDSPLPDYDLEHVRTVTSSEQLKGIFDPFRSSLLELLLERAATVSELAAAVGRPKSTVAYHVSALLDADLVRVVRTRRVRAIEERFYGRTARIFYVGTIRPEQLELIPNLLSYAAAESVPSHQLDRMRAILRHSRISRSQATEFWDRVFALVADFSALPRDGEETFGFVAGLYPTEHPLPTLPPPSGDAELV